MPMVTLDRALEAVVELGHNYVAKGTLDTDRERRLQELPRWTWDARADRALRRTP